MKGRTAQAILWMLVDVGGSQGLSFVIYVILSRILSPGTYGVFVVALAIIAITNVALLQGFGDALIQRDNIRDDDLNTAFWTNLAMSIVIAAGLVLCAPWLAGLYNAPDLGPVVASMALLCVLRALVSVHSALCRRELNMSLFAARAFTAYVLGGAAGITLALLGWGVWSLVVCQIVQAVAILFVMWMAVPWRPKLRFSTSSFLHLAQFSRSFITANILTSITDRIDSLIVGLFLDVTAVGYYALALKVMQTVGLITMIPLQAVMMPVLARLTLQRDKFVSQYTALVTVSMAASLPTVAGIGVVASTLLPLAFGDRWTSAVPVLRVMCFACVSIPLWNFTGQALSALGRPQIFARLALIQLILAVICFTLAANFGIVAVGAAWAGVSALMVPIHLKALQRSVGTVLTPLLVNSAKIALCGIAMVGVMMLIRNVAGEGLVATFAEITIGAAVYLALLEFVILPGYVANMTRTARAVLPVAGAAR